MSGIDAIQPFGTRARNDLVGGAGNVSRTCAGIKSVSSSISNTWAKSLAPGAFRASPE